MQLSDVERLTADYSECDVDEVAAVVQSTILTTPLAVLRWGRVQPSDAESWLRESYGSSLRRDFQCQRISSIQDNNEMPATILKEHLVVRDLDMKHLQREQADSRPGRIVAHADYRYMPAHLISPESHTSEGNSMDTSIPRPPGFLEGAHIQLEQAIETTLEKPFGGLPRFELRGISTLTPSHVRRGIAKRLTEWVFSVADQVSLPVVLSAAPLGLPLYRKCGFVEYRQYDVVIEMEQWGGEGTHRHVMMVRWPAECERLPEVWNMWREKHKPEQLQQM